MHKIFVGPSATEMILDLFIDFGVATAASQCWRLALAALLLAGAAMSSPVNCLCLKENHTLQCTGCSALPKNIPADVSRLNMTGNRVRHIAFPANVGSTMNNIKAFYLNNNNIMALHSEDLCPAKNVMVLDLSSNNLQTVEENSIACNRELTRLVLDDNPRLRLVPLRSHSLEVLYLQNCGLTSFDQELLKHLPKLRQLYLRRNDALTCPQIAKDLHKRRPNLTVHCDNKANATKITSTNHSNIRPTEYVPHFGIGDMPSEGLPDQVQDDTRHKIPLDSPILVVPLTVTLVVALVAVLFWLCKKPGSDVQASNEAGEGKLLKEPH